MHAIDTQRLHRGLDLALRTLDGPQTPPRLRAAMRHAVLSGGGRLRPWLALAVSHALGDPDPTLSTAVAVSVELLHCASLVHDDMPCFDDASTRRGLPTVHAKYGESTALLTGDALISLAFEIVAEASLQNPARGIAAMRELTRAVGASEGLMAGQAWESEPGVDLAQYHHLKTAVLFEAASRAAACAAGADPAPFTAFARALGAAYQLADDLLDVQGAASAAGKEVGQDAAHGRPNAAAVYGIDGLLARLAEHMHTARAAIPADINRAPIDAWLDAVSAKLLPAEPRAAANA